MNFIFRCCTLVIIFCCVNKLHAHELPSISKTIISKSTEDIKDGIAETKFFSDLNLTQLILKNGMTVWLKPTNFESDEIFIKLSALGGFASLNATDRPSGELAAQIAWESGLGELSTDQLSVLLYEHSLELATKIQPFSRIIEGTSGKEGLQEFLKCVNMIFTQHKLTEVGQKEALQNATKILSKIDSDSEQTYENAFLQVNTQNPTFLTPLSAKKLRNVDLQKAKAFYENCFTDPAPFACIIVGSFQLDEAKKLINKYLSVIPKKNSIHFFQDNFAVVFPPKITHKVITLAGRLDSLTRITFPLQTNLNEKNIPSMEFMCQIIEARLRAVITSKMEYSHGVDVSYEFPLYPLLDNSWISIRYRCDILGVNQIKDLILKELKMLQENGSVEQEMLEIKRLESGSEEFWLRDNYYWISMLSNYYLWNWSPEQIHKAESQTQNLTLDSINYMLKTYFILSNYSVITGMPQKI
ncbi:MAG: insulinase family protein [Parachlamydiaceae bacterium]|nr:insulinase family protein [Parachlamydiaceae bacterium]